MFTEGDSGEEGEKPEEKGVNGIMTSAKSGRQAESDHGPDNVSSAHFRSWQTMVSPGIP